MHDNYFLSIDDAVNKTGMSKETIQGIVSMKIIYPAQTSPIILFFNKDIKKLQAVKDMLDMGYSMSKIKRIIREIGAPETDADSKDKLYAIGDFCAKFNLNPRQIKYWEELGLFYPAVRSSGGIRLYSRKLLRHIHFIQNLQELGFTLSEIKEITDSNAVEIVEKRIMHINELIKELKPILKNMKSLREEE